MKYCYTSILYGRVCGIKETLPSRSTTRSVTKQTVLARAGNNGFRKKGLINVACLCFHICKSRISHDEAHNFIFCVIWTNGITVRRVRRTLLEKNELELTFYFNLQQNNAVHIFGNNKTRIIRKPDIVLVYLDSARFVKDT